MATTDLITAKDAAAILGVKPDTINKYVRRGYLAPAQKIHGRLWLYRRAEVEALKANPPKRTGRPPGKALRRLAGREGAR